MDSVKYNRIISKQEDECLSNEEVYIVEELLNEKCRLSEFYYYKLARRLFCEVKHLNRLIHEDNKLVDRIEDVLIRRKNDKRSDVKIK